MDELASVARLANPKVVDRHRNAFDYVVHIEGTIVLVGGPLRVLFEVLDLQLPFGPIPAGDALPLLSRARSLVANVDVHEVGYIGTR